MVISDTSSTMDGFTIALLTSGFGQVWAKLRLQKSRTTLGEIVGLYNCAVADKGSIDEYYKELDKAGIRKSRTNLGEIIGLHNCAVADKGSIDKDITPQLWHDVTPQLRSSAKRKDGGTNMMITYDVTPQQRLNPSAKRWMAEPADRL